MVEGLNKAHDTGEILRISLVERFYNVALSLGRVYVLLDWLYHLHSPQLTFTANTYYRHFASSTRPNVPVPNRRVTLYLWPSFSPILNLKWGVVLRLRVEEETELLREEEALEEDELEGLRRRYSMR